MKKTIIMFALVIVCASSLRPTKLIAVDLSPPVLTNKQVVENLVDMYSKQYGVSEVAMMKTIENEDGTFDFEQQSNLTYKKGNKWGFEAGTREQSFGVAQIHLPDHPNITKAEAEDPNFSIQFMAQQFAQGNERQWMGYEA